MRIFIKNECWTLFKNFFHLLRWSYGFSLLMCKILWLLFLILNQLDIPEKNSSRLLLLFFYILLNSICWNEYKYKNFYIWVILICSGFFLILPARIWYHNNTSKNELRNITCILIPWKNLCNTALISSSNIFQNLPVKIHGPGVFFGGLFLILTSLIDKSCSVFLLSELC